MAPMTSRRCCALALVALLVTGPLVQPAEAAKRATIVVVNVSAQAGATLASALINKKIHGVRDVFRCVWAGSAAGFGLYESKVLIGNGHVLTGWTVANLAGSLAENGGGGQEPGGAAWLFHRAAARARSVAMAAPER